MSRKTVADFHPEVMRLFDRYVHGSIARREFLSSAGKYAAAGIGAEGLLAMLVPDFAAAQQVAPGDLRIRTEYVEIPSPQGNGKVRGLLAKPANASGKLPMVLVIHENRGLNPHIEDIARRLAVDNFIAFAPDALFSLGGYPGDEDKARDMFTKLDQAKTREDFVAAAGYLKTLSAGNGKVGAVGFCYGGGIVNLLATRIPDFGAGVPFYGMAPSAEDAAKIKAAMLINYAESDERINAAWPAYETALKAAGVNYQAFIYPGTQHGFNNDTTPRFNEAAAKLAWQRTVAHFNKYLRS